jgi:hypothetical protein
MQRNGSMLYTPVALARCSLLQGMVGTMGSANHRSHYLIRQRQHGDANNAYPMFAGISLQYSGLLTCRPSLVCQGWSAAGLMGGRSLARCERASRLAAAGV